MIRQLWNLFLLLARSDKQRFFLLQILVIVMACLEIAGIAAIGPFVLLVSDSTIIDGDNLLALAFEYGDFSDYDQFVVWWGMGVVGVLILGGCVSMYTVWALSMFGQNIGVSLGDRLFKYYIHEDWLFHATERSSLLTKQIIAEANRVKNGIIVPVLQMNARLFAAIFISASLLIYDAAITLVLLSVFAISYFAVYLSISSRLLVNGTKISGALEKRYHLIAEALGGIRDVLLHRKQETYSSRFEKAGEELAFNQGEAVALSQMPRYLMEAISFGGIILLMLYLVRNEDQYGNVLALLSVYALAGLKLLPACQAIYANLSTIRSHLPALGAIEQDLLRYAEFPSKEDTRSNYEGVSVNFDRSFSLEGIHFRYPGADGYALKNVSLDIPKKKVIGIAGASGSGKSTLMDLMLGLIDPKEGRFLIDGQIASDERLAVFRNGFSCVSQTIFLADTTIAENVAFGEATKAIQEDVVDQALAKADLYKLITSLPEGKQALVGENGVQLSGGQRQRIGIARALYRKSEILFFDEATSSLDRDSERSIMDSIHRFAGSKTVVIVAHRLSTLEKCDVIHFMINGEIVDSGTYNELAERHVFFKYRTDL